MLREITLGMSSVNSHLQYKTKKTGQHLNIYLISSKETDLQVYNLHSFGFDFTIVAFLLAYNGGEAVMILMDRHS